MMVLWLVTAAALVVAVAAWRQARRTAARLEHVSQLYWELKYQQGELRVQMRRAGVDTGSAPDAATGSPGASCGPAPRTDAAEAFVPLASLKR